MQQKELKPLPLIEIIKILIIIFRRLFSKKEQKDETQTNV